MKEEEKMETPCNGMCFIWKKVKQNAYIRYPQAEMPNDSFGWFMLVFFSCSFCFVHCYYLFCVHTMSKATDRPNILNSVCISHFLFILFYIIHSKLWRYHSLYLICCNEPSLMRYSIMNSSKPSSFLIITFFCFFGIKRISPSIFVGCSNI